MKRFSLIVMAGLCGGMVHAQNNAAAPSSPASAITNSPAVPPPPRAPKLIHADSADFDLNGHQAIYRGHVRVDDPQMKLTCAQLTSDLPESGGRPTHIVAETNVVIDFTDDKGQTNHATSDKAVFLYNVQNGVTNETVTLTGNPQPQVENAQGTQAGDVIIWNRVNNNTHIRISGNYHMISSQNLNDVMTDTNSPTVIKTTNFSPGTIENLDKNTSNPPRADF
ncbi:MAG: LptA/OstA family protein [Limisphaerales bacterium]